MSSSQIPRSQIILLLVIVIAGGAFLAYQYQYKPLEEELQTASGEVDTLQQTLAQRQQAVQEAEALEINYGQLGQAVVSNPAIPEEFEQDDALIEIEAYAEDTGIMLTQNVFESPQALGIAEEVAAGGAQARTIQVEGFATYPDLLNFMRKIEGSVNEEFDRVYVRGRLFNITGFTVEPSEDEGSGTEIFGGLNSLSDDPSILSPPDDGRYWNNFTMTIQIFASDPPDLIGTSGDESLNPGADGAAAQEAGQQAAADGTADPNAGAQPQPQSDPGVQGQNNPDNVAVGSS